MLIERDFLPAGTIDALDSAFVNASDWAEELDLKAYGPDHQGFSGKHMPKNGEVYRTLFDRSAAVDGCDVVRGIGTTFGARHWRCYRMRAGHGIRIHQDAYWGGGYSATLYINRNWVWDWGGLLHVMGPGGSTCSVVCPERNTLVSVTNAPHFVSPVAEWAQQPRYVLAMFGCEVKRAA